MATRFMHKALSIAALGLALTPLLAETTSASPAASDTAGALQPGPPAAPSHCRERTTRFQDGEGHQWTFHFVVWTDNSTNEDGFTLETWRSQSGGWILASSWNLAANSSAVEVPMSGPGYKFRVKAFNASGDSAWSNWAH
jgi:hypothetical protein